MISIEIIILGGLVLGGFALLVWKGRTLADAINSKQKLKKRIADGETYIKDNKLSREARNSLISESAPWVIIGAVMVIGGLFIGFADRGDGLNFKEEAVAAWAEKVDDDGKYEAKNKEKYTYYIWLEGNKYYFCGEFCENTDALEEKLSMLGVGNRVLVIDNWATSAAYKSVISMLNEMGLKYETEEE